MMVALWIEGIERGGCNAWEIELETRGIELEAQGIELEASARGPPPDAAAAGEPLPARAWLMASPSARGPPPGEPLPARAWLVANPSRHARGWWRAPPSAAVAGKSLPARR
jgi:hypothetical protein